MNLITDVAGWSGALLLLFAYYLVSMKKVAGSSIWYQLLNIVGSILVGANSLYYRALPSFSMNVIWIVIALAAIARSSRDGPLDE